MVRTEFPEVHLLTREKELGCAKGASIGLEYLADKTTYVFTTTNAVEVDLEMIRQLMDYAEPNPTSGSLGPRFFTMTSRTKSGTPGHHPSTPRPSAAPGPGTEGSSRYNQIRECDFVTGRGFLLRSEVLKKVRYFKEDLVFYAEDTELCYRIRKHGYRILYLPTARMWHKIGTTLAKNRSLQLRYITRNTLSLLKQDQVRLYPISLFGYLLGACPAKMIFFAFCLHWANGAGIYCGIRDWQKGKYGWITG